ncbi:MAG TPA: hypothetical protein ENK56_05515, partial [Chloroflexi bacterium]|nr:hypothetical protein [Chloroflexota bacterium]
MSILQEVLNLVLTPPGDLYYHLALLFTLQILLAVAWGHWRRGSGEGGGRLLWAAGGLLSTRVVLIVASAAASSGLAAPAALLPPLERFLDLALIPLSAWAFLPVFRQHRRLGVGFLVGTLMAAGLAYAYFAVTWPPAEAVGIAYNTYWQAQVWEAASLLLSALALFLLLIQPGPGLGLLAAALVAWLIGHLAQLLLPSLAPHLAAATRLANLTAVPLLAALAFQEALRHPPAPSVPPPPSTDATVRLLRLARQIERARDAEAALASALPIIARYLRVDAAAVGMPAVGGAGPGVRIVAVHPASGAPLPTLPLDSQPLLSAAVRARRPQQDSAVGSDGRDDPLLRCLGFREPGPLLIEPLADGEEVLALLLLGNPKSKQPFTKGQLEQAHTIAEVLASALANATRRRAVERKAERLTMALQEQEAERTGRIAALQEELERAQQEAQEFARQLTHLEEEATRQRKRADELAELLRIREEQVQEAAATTAQAMAYEEELRQLTEARETLEKELQEWKQRAQELEKEQERLRQELQALRERPPTPSPEAVGTTGGTVVADERGNILLADRIARRLIGRSEEELKGLPLHAAFSDPTWAQTVSELVSGQTANGMTASVFLQQDGKRIRARLARLSAGPQGPSGYVALLQEESASDDRAEVVAALTNELRTPMTSIIGYTDLLLGESAGILGETQRKFLQRVKANIERLSGLINDLIEVTTIDAGRIELTP